MLSFRQKLDELQAMNNKTALAGTGRKDKNVFSGKTGTGKK